jgi:diguanylate cyclase (GGDEF)-like protein
MPRTHRRALAALLLACSPAAAQTVSPPPSDAARLVAEAERLRGTDAAATLRLAQRALPLLRGHAGADARMRALVLRCWAAAEAAPDSLPAYADRGVADAARHGDALALARLRVCRGYGRDQAGRPAEAMEDFDFGVAEGERLGARDLRAEALVLRGELRYYRGEYTAAVADLSTAYRLFTALDDRRQQRYALNAIANLYADDRVGQYGRALEYYRQVLASHQAAGSARGVATAHFNLGGTLERMGRLDEALAQYRRGLALDLERGDADEAAVDRRAIGALLTRMGRPAEALAELDGALARFRRFGDPERIAQARLSRGVALRMLGRTGEALAELEAARARFATTGNRRFLEKVQEERAAAFAAAGRWREAYHAAAEQVALQRALGDQARDEHTSRLRVQFDAEKKEAENRALLRENALRGQALAAGVRIRRLQLAVLGLSAVVIAALVLLAVRQLRSARRLRVVALTDELTRLPNRRHLLLLADEQVRAARGDGGGFAVLALDVDHFKQVNDRFGHDVGDAVLWRVATALRSALREGDHLGRTGGEEFVAVLPGASGPAAAEVAERVRAAVERTDFRDLHPELRVTVSVGAAVREPGDAGFADTLRRADDRLYRAKEAGRNRVELAASVQ